MSKKACMIFRQLHPYILSLFKYRFFFKPTKDVVPKLQLMNDEPGGQNFKRIGDIMSGTEKEAIKRHAAEGRKLRSNFSAY